MFIGHAFSKTEKKHKNHSVKIYEISTHLFSKHR